MPDLAADSVRCGPKDRPDAAFNRTIRGMWNRIRLRLVTVGAVLICVVWFLAAVVIATGPLGLEPRRGNLGILVLIFLFPSAVMVVVQELVHRIRNGPQSPGRHSREAERR